MMNHFQTSDASVDLQFSSIGQAAIEILRKNHREQRGSLWNVTNGSVVGPLQQIPRHAFTSTHKATRKEEWFPRTLGNVIKRTEFFCDVLHMAIPDGSFLDEFREALEYLDRKKKSIVIRMMFANFGPPLYTANLESLVRKLTRNLETGTRIRLWVGSWRSKFSWPHAKLIAVDGRFVHTGGYNMWHNHYLEKSPVFDLSVELQGNVAKEGHAFANAQWELLIQTKQGKFRPLDQNWGYNVPFNFVTLEAFPSSECNVFPPRWDDTAVCCLELESQTKSIPMLSLGGHVGWDGPGCSDDAIVAMISAAQTSIKIVNQDLGPMRHVFSNVLVESNAWPEDIFEAIGEAIWKRGVTVEVVLSNQKSSPGGWEIAASNYSNGWNCEDSAARIFNAMRRRCTSDVINDEDLRVLLGKKLRLCYLRTRDGNRRKDGSFLALHAKHFIVDDTISYIGSQNMYKSKLAEWGVAIDDKEQTQTFLREDWYPMFSASYRDEDCNLQKVLSIMEDPDRHSRSFFKDEWRPIVYSILNVLAWRPSKSLRNHMLGAMLFLASVAILYRNKSVISQLLSLVPSQTPVTLSIMSVLFFVVWREKRLQKFSTLPPIVHKQTSPSPEMDSIKKHMWNDGLFNEIQPSLFFGTNRWVATLAGFIFKGPRPSDEFLFFRQLLTMQDKATVALDWEVPAPSRNSLVQSTNDRKRQILDGPISQPVILVLHGIGNSTTSGYMRSIMRSCAKRGWIAVGMNHRGCGGSPITSPFGYNGAYTGDLRDVIKGITSRMNPGVPLLLIGHSIGANLMTKYLGEEGRSGTLPPAVVGGVSLANPCDIRSDQWSFPVSQVLGLVAKKTLLQTVGCYLLTMMKTPKFRRALGKAFFSFSMGQFDSAIAPILRHNDNQYPFTIRMGYRSAEEYWNDAGSYEYAQDITVPFLQITSQDDFLVYSSYKKRLAFFLCNPNLLIVETKTGGHLGWYETSATTSWQTSWAERATLGFLQSILSLQYQPPIPFGAHEN